MQNLLTESRWEGISIRTVIEDELAAYQHENENVCDVSGDAIVLRPKAGLAVSLAIHELTTNAAKYGSFSVPNGRVQVDWRQTQEDGADWFVLTWAETGGPPVAPPTRAGFGRMLLERTVALDLQGEVELSFAPTGVKCRLAMPASQIVSSTRALRAQSSPQWLISASERAPVAGLRVLLVEDAGLVALDVRETLEEQGMSVIGPYGSVRDALRAASQSDFDIALLDVDLDGEPVWPVADALSEADRPFVFMTAFESRMITPARFFDKPVVCKPYQSEELVAALSHAMSPAPSAG